MTHSTSPGRRDPRGSSRKHESSYRLLADGGRESDEAAEERDDSEEASDTEEESDAEGERPTRETEVSSVDTSNVEVTEAGDADPVDPKWEKPDVDDIPAVDGPKKRPAKSSGTGDAGDSQSGGTPGELDGAHTGVNGEQSDDSTAGMPNTARSPGQSRLKEGGVDGYVVALELCARLPDDVRLPEEAADLVPVALEAELEQDVQAFAAEEFDNPTPHVETLDFVEADDELWMRLRLGVDPDSFADFDPEEIQDHALQQIDRLL